MYVLSCFSCVRLFVTLWTIAHQAPLSMGFSRRKYWSGSSCPPPGGLPTQGSNPFCSSCVAGRFFTTEPREKPFIYATRRYTNISGVGKANDFSCKPPSISEHWVFLLCARQPGIWMKRWEESGAGLGWREWASENSGVVLDALPHRKWFWQNHWLWGYFFHSKMKGLECISAPVRFGVLWPGAMKTIQTLKWGLNLTFHLEPHFPFDS